MSRAPRKTAAAESMRLLIAREMEVPPPAVTNAPRWRTPKPIPLLSGPIAAGEVLIETQRNGDRANFTTLGGRRVCDYPIAGLTRIP